VIATAHLDAATIAFDTRRNEQFNFTSDSQSTFGYITSLTIGNGTLRGGEIPASKIRPRNGGLQAVAVLTQVSWDGG